MIMHNHLNRLLLIGTFCLSVLGLTGCSSYKARLGVGNSVDSTSQQAAEERSIADRSVDIAGKVGEYGMGVIGGAVGGALGAIGGGLYAVCSNAPIVNRIEYGAGSCAYYGSTIAASTGKHAFRGVTRGVIWGTPYVYNGLWWLASKACDGVGYAYNGLSDLKKRWTDGSCSLKPKLGCEPIDNAEQGTELKDLKKKLTCPLGLVIANATGA